MIRRHVGNDFFLIAQHDHAILAGELASHFGNDRFRAPEPREPVLIGASQHDSGWPLHDEHPTRNAAGLPLDVFEVSRPIALAVWRASADRAQAINPYAGLLTSLHVLTLSIFATSGTTMKHETFSTATLTEQFEINKFQHRELERQENLRKQLDLRLDLPLKHGLATPGADLAEDLLRFNFRMLQAMDLISLALCCTKPPTAKTQDVLPNPDQPNDVVQLALKRVGNDVLVDPWPFDVESISLRIPFRRVPAQTYASDDALRQTFANATTEYFDAIVRPT